MNKKTNLRKKETKKQKINIMEKEKIKIREKETKFLKEKLKNKQNLLVIGDKGVGKTTIIEQSINKLKTKWHIWKNILQIDLMELQNSDNLFFHLSFKGKNQLFIKFWKKKLAKFLTFFISYASLIVSFASIVSNNSIFNSFDLIWLFVFLPLLAFFPIIIISWIIKCFSKFNTNKIIHFHEMNFINSVESREKVIKIIWKIKNIYKNHLLVFESDQKFDKELKYKFNLKEIHLIPINKWTLIEDLFNELESEFKNKKFQEKLLKNLKNSINMNEECIEEIFYKLSYRTFKSIIDDFKDLYIFSKQGINLLDFLILKFLQLKNEKLYYDIMKEEKYNELTDNNISLWEFDFDNKIKEKNNKAREDFLAQIHSIIPITTKYIKDILPSDKNQTINFKNKTYSFFNPKYKKFYFSILEHKYLEFELLTLFKDKPLHFLKEINELNLFELEIFKFIEDKEIIEFLDFIEKQNSDKLFDFFLENDVLIKRETFSRLRNLIFKTRKDKKKFFLSLPKKYKHYFLYLALELFGEIQLKNWLENWNNFIPFDIDYRPKNLLLIGSHYNDKKIFGYLEYCKNIINKRNKFLTLLILQSQENDDKFFVIKKGMLPSNNSFMMKCIDEFNQNISKKKKLKIKQWDTEENKYIEINNNELKKYRNFKK